MTTRYVHMPEELIDQLLQLQTTLAAVRADIASPASAKFIEAAFDKYHRDGEIEVDRDNALTSAGDEGAYVMAWVWVSNKEAGITSEEEEVDE